MILRDTTSEVRNTLKVLKSSICVTAVFDMQYWEAEIWIMAEYMKTSYASSFFAVDMMFMSASSIKRKSTLLLREVARRFIFKSATTFPGRKQWTREPDDYTLTDDKIEIITQPGTDLWQRTYYHFRNDNAPVLQIETEEKFFSFMVKTDFKESHHRFDQCGVVMYLDSENWLKGSIEYENDYFQHLGSVVTNNGYSDWATTEIDAEIESMWYRLSRREDDYCIECSEDGIRFKQMRICHMWAGAGKIKFGIYACSPEDSSFKAVFTDMKLTECQWKAHDGQKPDEM